MPLSHKEQLSAPISADYSGEAINQFNRGRSFSNPTPDAPGASIWIAEGWREKDGKGGPKGQRVLGVVLSENGLHPDTWDQEDPDRWLRLGAALIEFAPQVQPLVDAFRKTIGSTRRNRPEIIAAVSQLEFAGVHSRNIIITALEKYAIHEASSATSAA